MTDSSSDAQQREIKKRPRPVISCLQCRQKKLKCDRLLPCQQCIKGGRTQLCAYADGQEPELRKDIGNTNDAAAKQVRLSNQSAPPTLLAEQGRVDEVLDRLHVLERALQVCEGNNPRDEPNNRPDETDTEILHNHKCWECSVGQFQLASQFIDTLPSLTNDVELVSIAQETYAIQQSLQRSEHRIRAPYAHISECTNHMIRLLPDQKVCESLIDLYFQNFEQCSRILHRPTFIQSYQDSAANRLATSELQKFLPLLLGVLLVASLLNTLQECELPSLRGEQDGIGVKQLLQNWVELQTDDLRYDVVTLQTKLLLMLSMKLQGDDDKNLWTLSGQLVREAMLMGFHKSSDVSLAPVDEEMRKRLWITVCELDFAHAISLRMPASTPAIDESRMPSNVNDEDLLVSTFIDIKAKLLDEWTDGTSQYILGQTFNTRIDAYNYSFTQKPLRYNEALNKARTLEHLASNLPSTFKLDPRNPPGRLLAQMEVDISLRRPLIALYTPFALAMPLDDRFRDARIAWVQANLVVLCFQDLFDPKFPAIEVPRPEGYWDLYYTCYRIDDIKGLHAQVIELQRMKDAFQQDLDGANPGLQQHPHRSGSRALGWTIKGMVESIEDTIDPLIRRVGRRGPDFSVVMRYQLAYETLRCEHPKDLVLCVRSALKAVLHTIRSKLHREGHVITSDGSTVTGQAALQWFATFLLGEASAGAGR